MTLVLADCPVGRARDLMDLVCEPMFLLSVDRHQTMRFVRLNRTHESQTGMRTADIAGKTPHEALPPRLAETVAANYTRCVTSAARYTYDEVLDLPSGVRHWRTTLSPIFSSEGDTPRRVVGILGIATDISALKAEISRIVARMAGLRRQCEDAALGAASTVQRLRGPLALIVSLAKTLDLDAAQAASGTARSPDVAAQTLILGTARDALGTVDDIGGAVRVSFPTQLLRSVDLSHLIRDQTALVDPQARLALDYPRLFLLTDPPLLENVLQRFFTAIAASRVERVTVSAESVGNDAHMFALRLALHGWSPTTAASDMLLQISNLVTVHGGDFSLDRHASSSTTVVTATLPGSIDFTGPVSHHRASSEGLTAPWSSERAPAKATRRRKLGRLAPWRQRVKSRP